jgi:hypothetical protein
MVLRFAVAAAALTGLLLYLHPEWFLCLPRHRPLFWCVIMVLYPLLSVVPQGLAYRAFLFHRYRALAPDGVLFVLAVLAFSFAHVPFRNWVAIVLTLPGGWIFNRTYLRTQSLPLSCIEQSLYGCLLFTLGYGEFFFHGSMQLARTVAGG